jgi:hypothetical protein
MDKVGQGDLASWKKMRLAKPQGKKGVLELFFGTGGEGAKSNKSDNAEKV